MLRRLVITAALLLTAGLAQAQTAAQLQMLQGLSPSQLDALMQQYGGAAATPQPQAPLTSPELVQPLPEAPPEAEQRAEQGPLRVRPGDTLIVTVAKSAAPGAGLDEAAVLSPIAKLLGSTVFQLDAYGTLDLPGIARVPLTGLSAEQASARLSAEPALKGFTVGVQILPLEPTGPQALKPFGYELFKGAPTTFAPATDIPVPPEYVIGPGDTIQLQLFGKENAEYSLVVTRDGTVQIPKLGPRTVAGLSFAELQQRVNEYVSEQMIGVRASVTMGPLRSIRVFVLGDAQRPGSYTVSGLSTITNALFVSGGIKTNGSLRNIELKRGGRLVQRMDLYDLLLKGDTRDDVRLLPGDVIFVPPVGATVGVAGEVRRPAIYELKGEKTVGQVVDMAGGMRPTAARDVAQLERIAASGERIVIDVDLRKGPGATVALRDGDVLRLPSVLDRVEGYVRLTGHVERPGSYEWREGLRLADLIPRVDLLKPRADLDYVLVKRELPPERRIEVLSARLSRAWAYPESEDNLLLQSRDEVLVFSLEENRADLIKPLIDQLRSQARADDPERVVNVQGNVAYPGDYPLEGGMRVSSLIRAGGGLSQQAYTLEAELTRYQVIDGKIREVARQPVDLAAILGGEPGQDIELRPFDTLNVKQVPEWRRRETVEIAGEVLFPGKYVVEKGETLSGLIERAGGFTDRAYLPGAVFLRTELQQKEQEQINRLREQLRADLAAISLQQSQEDPRAQQAVSTAQGLLQQLETTKAVGRLVIDLPKLIRQKGPADVVLRDGDRLLIPQQPQEVTVIGEVNYPTSHLYDEGLARDDYIQRSGGLTYKADDSRIYVVRANGEVLVSSGSRWFGGAEQEIMVGDTIVVPLDAERMRPLTLWTSVTQIVYQLALSAAALNAVGAF